MKNVSVKLQTLNTTSVLSTQYIFIRTGITYRVRTSEFLNTIHDSIQSLTTAG